MSEPNERIASLEAKAATFEKVADKWDRMLVQVTEINSNLTNMLGQFDTYRLNCDAERTAHGHRLGGVENAITKLTEICAAIPDYEERLESLEKQIAKGNTVWWVIVKIAATAGGLAGFAATIFSMRHP